MDRSGGVLFEKVKVTYRRVGDNYILTLSNGSTQFVNGTGTADSIFGGRSTAHIHTDDAPEFLRLLKANDLARLAKGAGVLGDIAEAAFITIKRVEAHNSGESVVAAVGPDVAGVATGTAAATATAAALRGLAPNLPPLGKAAVTVAAGFWALRWASQYSRIAPLDPVVPAPCLHSFTPRQVLQRRALSAELLARRAGRPHPDVVLIQSSVSGDRRDHLRLHTRCRSLRNSR